MRRNTCRGCERERLECFLDLGQMPLAGGFLSGPEAIASEKTFPLPVHVCLDCGLVQILEVVDPEVLFQDYSFSSSTVGSARRALPGLRAVAPREARLPLRWSSSAATTAFFSSPSHGWG